jgi:hypothetical protein
MTEKWFKPGIHTGWDKDMPPEKRRALVLKAHKGNMTAAGRSMQALSNVSTDDKTREVARADALYFFGEVSKESYIGRRPLRRQQRISPGEMRITPKEPRIR